MSLRHAPWIKCVCKGSISFFSQLCIPVSCLCYGIFYSDDCIQITLQSWYGFFEGDIRLTTSTPGASDQWQELTNGCWIIWWQNSVIDISALLESVLLWYRDMHFSQRVHSCHLTHWGRDKMAAIFQTMFSNAFSWMKMHELRLRFHWRLFRRVQLTIFQHWFR